MSGFEPLQLPDTDVMLETMWEICSYVVDCTIKITIGESSGTLRSHEPLGQSSRFLAGDLRNLAAGL